MKLIAKIAAVVICLCAITFFLLRGMQEPVPENKSESVKLNLFETADSADFMIAYAMGIGDVKRKRTIDGRLYRNFVQLLRTDRMQENAQDTFATECKTGLRLAFYKDTTLVDEFLFADRFGRDGVTGVWIPRRLGKINKFLKDNGVQFMACSDSTHGMQKLDAPEENSRPIFTMPEIGAARKRKKDLDENAVTENVPDEILNGTITNNVLDALDGLILPADTAVGEPLYKQVQNCNRGEVSFYKKVDNRDSLVQVVSLTEKLLDEFKNLLKTCRYETFASSVDNQALFSKTTLFQDDQVVMELWNSKKYEWISKFPMSNGKNLGSSGTWFAADPGALQAFFDNLR